MSDTTSGSMGTCVRCNGVCDGSVIYFDGHGPYHPACVPGTAARDQLAAAIARAERAERLLAMARQLDFGDGITAGFYGKWVVTVPTGRGRNIEPLPKQYDTVVEVEAAVEAWRARQGAKGTP